MRHLNNGTDHRHSKSCCDQSSPARRTITAIGRVGWRLNMYELSSFVEIGRNPSISGNIVMTLGIEGPGSSASRWETKGQFFYCRCWIMAKSVWIVEFRRNLKKSIEIWQYCPNTENRGPWVLSVQVGDKGLKLPLEGSDGGWICIMVEFWRSWKELIEIRQYCHYTGNRGPWVLSEQVGDKGLILAL